MVRSIVVAAALFVVYEGVVRSGKVREGNPGSFYAMNSEREEKFLYGREAKAPVAISGSSLSDNISRYWKRVTDLGFPFSNAMTGIILVERGTQPPPKAMIVEVNQPVMNGINAALVGIVQNPITRVSIKNVYAFRQTYQPYNVLRSYISKGDSSASAATPSKKADSSVRDERVKSFSKPMTPEEEATAARLLDEMGEHIKRLQEKGVKVYLHHIPTDPQVDASPWIKRFNEISEQHLTPICNNWLRYDGPPVTWDTLDGLHLTAESAKTYGEWLDKKLVETGDLPPQP